jgi:hypothetical protein
MSGQWPPEWEDSDDGPSDAGLPDGSAVASFLAQLQSPALPPSFEARISAAIAAEAAARAATPQAATPQAAATEAAGAPVAEAGAEDAKDRVRSANPEELSAAATAGGSGTSANRRLRRASRTSRRAAASSGPGGSRPGDRRRRLRMPSAKASSWLVVCCLVIAGFGFLISHTSGSSSSSSPDSAAAGAAPTASSQAGASEPRAASGSRPENADDEPSASASANVPTGFLFTETGTRYQSSTLASQVQAKFIVYGALSTPGAVHSAVSPPPGTAASGAAGTAPASTAPASSAGPGAQKASPQLEGCVWQLTGGVTPSLVDKASYDGTPAYIVAVPTQVWVVGLGCTAAHTDVITRESLEG